jgi:hypothetical protein
MPDHLTIETFEAWLEDAKSSLLKMARDATWNSISNNCLYILIEGGFTGKNFAEENHIRKQRNEKKKPKSLAPLMPILTGLYPDLYEVDLLIYRSRKNITIVEIVYWLRNSVEFAREIADPILHCKVAIPPYRFSKKEKFDVNWQLNTWECKWKCFG